MEELLIFLLLVLIPVEPLHVLGVGEMGVVFKIHNDPLSSCRVFMIFIGHQMGNDYTVLSLLSDLTKSSKPPEKCKGCAFAAVINFMHGQTLLSELEMRAKRA